MTDVVLRAERTLIDGTLRAAAVAIVDGRIADIGAFDADYPAAEAWLPSNAVLLPGFVDTHVHINEPGTDWEGFATATAAAATGGVTTLVDMPLDSDPVTTTVAALRAKQAVAHDNRLVDVGYWAGVVPDNLHDLAPLATAGVCGFKCFLTDSGNPNFPHLTPGQFRQAMARIAELDSVLLVHAESHDVIEGGQRPCGRDYSSFLNSRPDAAEEDAVALVPVTAETCPHYLTFAAEDIPDGGTEFAACPPIRGSANRNLLWGGLLEGTLDMVVSDHSPCAPEYKGSGDFGQAFGGVSSLQLGPRAVWTHAEQRGFGVADLSRWMSERPAALAGLVDRGRVAVGLRADFCVFDPDAEEVIDAGALRHRHPVSPYHGMALRGSVLQTWSAGQLVFDRVREPA